MQIYLSLNSDFAKSQLTNLGILRPSKCTEKGSKSARGVNKVILIGT